MTDKQLSASLSGKLLFCLSFLFLLLSACTETPPAENIEAQKAIAAENEKQFEVTLQKHLDAVANKDLAALKSTLSPDGKMQLILPQSTISNTVEAFVAMHKEWFQDTTWTFDTKVLNTEIGDKTGFALTEILYREPERNGKPYFNRMAVSYGLKKVDGNWYVVQDHACSLEKTEEE